MLFLVLVAGMGFMPRTVIIQHMSVRLCQPADIFNRPKTD